MTQDKHKLKRNWVEQAVSLALRSRWDEAIGVNESILSLFPDDADAFNRLGKAYTELGRYAEARDAYDHTLKIDAFNTIARKNLQRLASLRSEVPPVAAEVPAAAGEARVSPQLFLETMGKTGTTLLVSPADPETLARATAGAPVNLVAELNDLAVYSLRGDRLGYVEPRMGQRLIRFMKAGNRYAAAITSLDTQNVKVIIRETFQHPSMTGRVSFPPRRSADGAFRAYTKESLLKLDEEDEDRVQDDGELSADAEPVEEPAEEPEPFEEQELADQ